MHEKQPGLCGLGSNLFGSMIWSGVGERWEEGREGESGADRHREVARGFRPGSSWWSRANMLPLSLFSLLLVVRASELVISPRAVGL